MKTATIDGVNTPITYKTNTGMYTRLTAPNGKTSQYGADIYQTDDGRFKVLVATAFTGNTLKQFVSVVTDTEYAKIADLYDPYNAGAFHLAVMHRLGFN